MTTDAARVIDAALRKRNTRPPRLVAWSFSVWGLVPGTVAAVGLNVGGVQLRELLVVAFFVAWLAAGAGLQLGQRRAIGAALALLAIPWSWALAQTVGRVAFILREGDLERADGLGSPAAFLLGAAFELLVVFIPLTVLAILLVRAAFRKPDDRLSGRV